jgi:hypothetical protein
MATANQRPVVMLLLVLAVASLAAYGAWRLLADIGG